MAGNSSKVKAQSSKVMRGNRLVAAAFRLRYSDFIVIASEARQSEN